MKKNNFLDPKSLSDEELKPFLTNGIDDIRKFTVKKIPKKLKNL